jgi:hypothetical protein
LRKVRNTNYWWSKRVAQREAKAKKRAADKAASKAGNGKHCTKSKKPRTAKPWSQAKIKAEKLADMSRFDEDLARWTADANAWKQAADDREAAKKTKKAQKRRQRKALRNAAWRVRELNRIARSEEEAQRKAEQAERVAEAERAAEQAKRAEDDAKIAEQVALNVLAHASGDGAAWSCITSDAITTDAALDLDKLFGFIFMILAVLSWIMVIINMVVTAAGAVRSLTVASTDSNGQPAAPQLSDSAGPAACGDPGSGSIPADCCCAGRAPT